LTAFEEHLEQRWSEGCHNAAHLLAEIRALGYRGGYTAVRDFLQPLRARAALPPLTVSPTAKRFASPPSPRRLAWLVTNRSHPCARAQDMAFLDALASTCTEVKQAMEAAQSLCAIIRERRAVEELDTWLTATQQSGVAEIKALASSLQMDRVAVAAALSLPWSNGQVEGQVNRLKFLKRSMYGSAGYDLLRARVLPFQAATVIMARPA
jgi:transposase